MFWNLFTTTAFIIAGIVFYRFWPAIFARLKRFDDQNRARIEGEIRDRGDSLAHFRHTLRVAEEQVDRELLLAREVAVDRALGHRGRESDLLGRGLGDAARHEQRERCPFDARLGLVGLAHR